MAVVERSFADVMRDLIGNVQEIVRSEVGLVKAEIREEAARAKSAAVILSLGGLTGVFAALFVLLSLVSGLALVVPNWAANLIVGLALAVVAGITIASGVKRFKTLSYVGKTEEPS